MTATIQETLLEYLRGFEPLLQNRIDLIGEPEGLREVIHYALTNGGKRFRPALVHLVAEGIGKNMPIEEASLAVEYFHVASLIADDLPCMDDDGERRGKPAVHVVFGEAKALLASYALIAMGYEAIGKNSEGFHGENKEKVVLEALRCATKRTGIEGATGGQYYDLFPENGSYEQAQEVILRKTASLFSLSFALGWLFGGGDVTLLNQVEKAATHFGMAFQIADDRSDVIQDQDNGRSINIVALLGEKRAEQVLQQEIDSFLFELDALPITSPPLEAMAQRLRPM